MSDDAEKPFDATPQRMEKARREGNVARSSELGANVAFAAAAFAVAGVAPVLGATARRAILDAASGRVPWPGGVGTMVLALLPILGGALAGAGAGVLQSGGVRVGGVSAKFERLNPIEGLRRMCSRETAAHALRAAAAFGIALGLMLPTLITAASEMVRAATVSAVAASAWHAAEALTFAACATGLVFAMAEYAAARSTWLRKLRMSFDERKREAKEQDGDPFARGRRRSLHRSLLRGALANARDASFVVTNPTHLAVALRYRPPEIAVPVVVVKAAGKAALRVRTLAAEHGVAIVENVALARALFRDGRAGQPIAQAHYAAVAEIVVALARSMVPQS